MSDVSREALKAIERPCTMCGYATGDPDEGCEECACRAIDYRSEQLLDGCTVAMQDFTTEELLAIAAYRDQIGDGWMQTMIRQYVEVWR